MILTYNKSWHGHPTEDRCTDPNAAKTLTFCLYSKTTSWRKKKRKQIITYKIPNQSAKSVVARDFELLLCDRDSGFSTLKSKNKNKTSEPTNQKNKHFPMSLTGDISFDVSRIAILCCSRLNPFYERHIWLSIC